MDKPLPLITVNIAIYQQKDNLRPILEALKAQTVQNFEVSITDDGSHDGTREIAADLIEEYRPFFELRYLWQEDQGFRLAKSKNMGIRKAQGTYFLSIEGDTIPHYRMIEAYMPHLDEKTVLLGVRHDIPKCPELPLDFEKLDKSIIALDYRLETLKSWKNIDKPYRYASGCNLLLPLEILKEVGRWDENFQGYGKDDYDVVMRMIPAGCSVKPVVNSYCYHIDHKHGYSQESEDYFAKKEAEMDGI